MLPAPYLYRASNNEPPPPDPEEFCALSSFEEKVEGQKRNGRGMEKAEKRGGWEEGEG